MYDILRNRIRCKYFNIFDSVIRISYFIASSLKDKDKWFLWRFITAKV